MFTGKAEAGAVVIEAGFFPSIFIVATLATLSQAAFMPVLLFMTGITGFTGCAKFLSLYMA